MKPLKRYLVFVGRLYEPAGGWSDFHASYARPGTAFIAGQSAAEKIAKNEPAWTHVIDGTTGAVVSSADFPKLKAPAPPTGHGSAPLTLHDDPADFGVNR